MWALDIASDGIIVGGNRFYYDQYRYPQSSDWLLKTNFSGQVVWDRRFASGDISQVKIMSDGAIAEAEWMGKTSVLFKFYPTK